MMHHYRQDGGSGRLPVYAAVSRRVSSRLGLLHALRFPLTVPLTHEGYEVIEAADGG